ncbi:MAG: 30S ribosomal protein S6 [Candidatus Kerfeldbacteria bacterium]|nr:30S ribosomal protein S6 [Candidatus Kerfeldbacteria bacterium]
MEQPAPNGLRPEPGAGSAPIPSPIKSGKIGEAAPDTTDRPGTYELMAIFPATLSEEEVAAAQTKVKAALTERGAVIETDQDFGKRKLAYAIKHVRQGVYHLYTFRAPKLSLQTLESELQLMPEVLRHLIMVRTVRTQAQLEAKAALRERIQAKRMAAEERAVAERTKEAIAAPTDRPAPAPTREVSKEELEQKLEEILKDETLGE